MAQNEYLIQVRDLRKVFLQGTALLFGKETDPSGGWHLLLHS